MAHAHAAAPAVALAPAPTPAPAPTAPAPATDSRPEEASELPHWMRKFLAYAHPILEFIEGLGVVGGVISLFSPAIRSRTPDEVKSQARKLKAIAPFKILKGSGKGAIPQFALITARLPEPIHKEISLVFLPQLGENQQAEFQIHVVEMTHGLDIWEIPDDRVPPNKIPDEVLEFLSRVANIAGRNDAETQILRVAFCDAHNLIRGNEDDYPSVKSEMAMERISEQAVDGARKFVHARVEQQRRIRAARNLPSVFWARSSRWDRFWNKRWPNFWDNFIN